MKKIGICISLFLVSVYPHFAWSQSENFTRIKYALIFVDQPQMLYDGTDLKKVNHPIDIAGDMAYYNGKYGNASGRYFGPAGTFFNNTGKRTETAGDFDISIPDVRDLSDMPTGEIVSGFSTHSVLKYTNPSPLNNDQLAYYTAMCNVMGMLHMTRGNYVKAEELLTIAIEERGKRFGQTSAEFINSLHNMAVLRKFQGQYAEAEKIFNYLQKATKKLYFYTSPNRYVTVLNNRAMLLAELGRSKEALENLETALELGKDYFDETYIDYERMLTNKAFLLQENGRSQEALRLYEEVIASMEQKGFENHTDYDNVLIYYGSLRVSMGDQEVYAFLNEVVDNIRKRYKKDHPLYAKALTNVADYHFNENRFDLALPVLEEAKAAQLESLGDRHKDYLKTLIKLGVCQWKVNNLEASRATFNEANAGYLYLTDNFFSTLSESEKGKLWSTMKPGINTYFNFAIENSDQDPSLLRMAYEIHIKTKGLLINSTTKIRNTILSSQDSTLTALYKKYLDTKNLLAEYYGSPKEVLEENEVDLKALETYANKLEKELATKTNLLANDKTNLSYEMVTGALGSGEAAIEIIRYPVIYGLEKGKVNYAALIATKNSPYPKVVKMEDGEHLEAKALTFYKNAIRLKIADKLSYNSYWKEIAAGLEGYNKVYISVDGVYNSISLNTLQNAEGTYVLDQLDLVLVPNTKSIAAIKNQTLTLSSSQRVTLFGNPEYGNPDVVTPLPGTQEEVTKIEELLNGNEVKTTSYMQQRASEENFSILQSPDVLHIATHGFFLPDVDLSKNMVMGTNVSKAKDNPLLRSGLLFTGAANVYDANPQYNPGNNGVLNAFEVMNLNLNDTELVIMSACETGTGEVVNGEGVYGLTRAFQVAGAKKIVMSLWKVNDNATRDLMTTFYENWIALKDPQAAFTYAQKSLKEKYRDPYYWGAFVLLN